MISLYFFDSLSSTMDEARSRALQGEEGSIVIVAREQTHGRGRRGRKWESSIGNLYFTYSAHLDIPLARAPQLSFVACVAVGEELRRLLPPGNSLSYKWPNDLLLNEKKVAGLLLESLSIPGRDELYYLIGCGLNLKTRPQNVRYPATSLQDEGIYLSIEDVLNRLVSSLEHYISLWKKEGFSPIHKLWMEEAANLEKKISIDLQGKIQEGIFKGIDHEGALLLEAPQRLHKFLAGEILLLEENHVVSR